MPLFMLLLLPGILVLTTLSSWHTFICPSKSSLNTTFSLAFLLLRLKPTFLPFCIYSLSVAPGKPVDSVFKISRFRLFIIKSLLTTYPYFSLGILKYLLSNFYASFIAYLQTDHSPHCSHLDLFSI